MNPNVFLIIYRTFSNFPKPSSFFPQLSGSTSFFLLLKCSPTFSNFVHYFPNVVDEAHFSQARAEGARFEDIESIPSPRIGFIGAISEYKVDFPLIRKIAESRPDWHWVMIGQVGEGQPGTRVESLELPNIHFLGPKPYRDLPAYLRSIDVAVLPVPMNPYTRSMFPMKFFEYLSAGKPVVSSDLHSLQSYSNCCFLSSDWQSFLKGIQAGLEDAKSVVKRGIAVAEQHTWDIRMDWMENLMGKIFPDDGWSVIS